ncbi:MAG: hypothetical protein AAF481_01090 [Acidobacteriota bacterium]
MFNHAAHPQEPLSPVSLRQALTVVLAAALIATPVPAAAVGGALQTISGGGKEIGFLPFFTMNPRLELDLALIATACAEDPPAHLNCDPLPGGVDQIVTGVGLRNSGEGTIALRGLPSGSVAVQAFLYWGRITEAPDRTDHLKIRFAGRLLTGELIDVTDNPCWTEFGVFAAYRANVPLDLLQPRLNNDYAVELFGAATTDGSNPFDDPINGGDPPLPLDDGASLMLVYSEPSIPATSRVWIHEGPFEMTIGAEIDHALVEPIPNETTALRISRVGGDGQTQIDGLTVLPYTTSIGRADEDFLAFRGPYTDLDRTSDFSGFDAAPHNQLWDSSTSELVLADTSILTGDTSYRLMYFATDTPGPCCCPEPQSALAPQPLVNGIKFQPTDQEPQEPGGGSGGECEEPEGAGPQHIPNQPRTLPAFASDGPGNVTPLPAPGAGETVYLDCVVTVAHALTAR